MVRGSGIQKRDFVESGFPCIHYGQLYTYYGLSTDAAVSSIEEGQYRKAKKALPGDVVITLTSENVDDVCTPLVWEGETPAAISGHSCALHPSINSRYIAYYLQTDAFAKQKRKYAKGIKVIEIKPTEIAEIMIPVPPLEVQERIVAILDRFDALTTSLTDGLPAEIEARRKQYEYYRDKLLDFPRKESA